MGQDDWMQINARTTPEDLGPEFELEWPPALFQEEARAVLGIDDAKFQSRGKYLLEEAFLEDFAAQTFDESAVHVFADWPGASSLGSRGILAFLADNADRLPKISTLAPYWAHRHSTVPKVPATPLRTFQDDFKILVQDFIDRGYLSMLAPKTCVDADDYGTRDITEKIDWQIQRRAGISDFWTTAKKQSLPLDSMYTLVEVFHDLVARPRYRSYHDYGRCGWHYSDHARRPGQDLYRLRVEELLLRHGIEYRLADSGEDRGRLVHRQTDARSELIEHAIEAVDPKSKNSVEHGIALFRKRGVTRDDKRSACAALALVLEDRRQLLKEKMHSKDEGMLFQIANQFHIRHRNAGQHEDYGDEFLDWTFWIYLSTIELTNKVLARPV